MYCYIMTYFRALILFCAYLLLIIETVAEVCDDRRCRRGPLTHYHTLQCKPEYELDKCCPVRYNCDHLYDRIGRRHNTCYINNNEYALGVKLREYDSIICEEDCTCISKNGFADFECKIRKDQCLPYNRTKPGCYQHSPIHECCTTEEVCLDHNNDTTERVYCRAPEKEGGLTYHPGEYIRKQNIAGQNLLTICEGNRTDNISQNEGYSNVFSTIAYNRWYDVHAAADFYKNCAPVYLLDQATIGIYRKTWRCQKPGDYVVHLHKDGPMGVSQKYDDRRSYSGVYGEYDEFMVAHGPLPAMHCMYYEPVSSTCRDYRVEHNAHKIMNKNEPCRLLNPDGPRTVTYNMRYKDLCKFGQMTMHTDDVLNRIPYGNNSCIVCLCDVPPVPTCVLYEDKSCYEIKNCSTRKIVYGRCY